MQQLAVTTEGGVVQPAQPLMVIVPTQGIVETISRDAVQPEQSAQAQNGAPAQTAPVYNARIRLSRNYVQIGQRRQSIGAGLAVQAEILTGRCRIIQYLLSPISQAMDEAGRER